MADDQPSMMDNTDGVISLRPGNVLHGDTSTPPSSSASDDTTQPSPSPAEDLAELRKIYETKTYLGTIRTDSTVQTEQGMQLFNSLRQHYGDGVVGASGVVRDEATGNLVQHDGWLGLWIDTEVKNKVDHGADQSNTYPSHM